MNDDLDRIQNWLARFTPNCAAEELLASNITVLLEHGREVSKGNSRLHEEAATLNLMHMHILAT
jgi:hypothetical protein